MNTTPTSLCPIAFTAGIKSARLLIPALRIVGAALLCWVPAQAADTPLATYLFEATGDASAWTASAGSALSIVGNADVLPVSEGRRCLQFQMTGTAAGSRNVRNETFVPVTVATIPGTTRRVSVSLALRSEGFQTGDLMVRVLEQTSTGVSKWLMDTTDFIQVPASRQWTTYSKVAFLRDDTARLYVYVYVMDGANNTGTLWMDDVRITALEAHADYLVEAVSGKTGNVFQADTGVMTVSLYDPRTASLGVTVLDYTGGVASAADVTISTLTAKKRQITFNQKGYYQVRATVTPSAGASVIRTWSAAVLGQDTPAVSPFGVFSVNSDNPLATAAGAKWNRYFIHFRNVAASGGSYRYTGSANKASSEWLSGTASVTSSMRYLPESVDHTWIACLDGIPNALLPAGKTSANRRQWEYYNDKTAFKAMLRWVLEDLPPFVQHIETCNEPEWGNWGGTWAQLGDYIKTVKEVVDEVNVANPGRGLKLIGPVFAHLPTSVYPDTDTNPASNYGFASKYLLLDNLLNTQGVAAHLDGISMHAYGNGGPPEDQFLTRLDGFRSYLTSIGAGGLPVYFTEFGWQSGNTGDWQAGVTERAHADYTARSWLLLLARAEEHGIEGALSFCLRNGSPASFDHYSFLNLDSTPRLPFFAYARTAREVAGFTAARRYIHLASDVRVFTATGGGETLLVLWTKVAASRVTPVPMAATSARDLYGRPVTLGGTTKQVTATQSPVFIKVTGEALGNYTTGPSYSLAPGSTSPVEFTEMICPPIFEWVGSNLHVSSVATTGSYTILGRSGSVWKSYPITVF
ncbi:MAG TPA: hypothetical protein VK985_12575 [Rariglobus sp.]|nr:hypothetical protein [Rariglobus sp.]